MYQAAISNTKKKSLPVEQRNAFRWRASRNVHPPFKLMDIMQAVSKSLPKKSTSLAVPLSEATAGAGGYMTVFM